MGECLNDVKKNVNALSLFWRYLAQIQPWWVDLLDYLYVIPTHHG